MSVITRAIKSSLDASTDALKAAEEALAAAKIANIHAQAAYDAFCVSGYIPPFAIDGHKKKEEECANCKQSVCLHGRPLTESLIKNPVGLRVMTHGDSWKEEQKEMIGTIQSVKKSTDNSFLMVLWDSKNSPEQFTILSKGSSKFIVYCKAQKLKITPPSVTPEKSNTLTSSSENLNDAKCSNCKKKKCVHGKFLTTFNSNNTGISVKHVDFHTDKVGKIANFDEGFVGIQWDRSKKVKRYMFIKTDDNDQAQFQFRFYCKSNDDSKEAIKETETKPVDTSTEEFFDAVEGEDEDISIGLEDEDPEFIVLSSPSSEIVDVEKDDNHNEESKIVKSRSTPDIRPVDLSKENIVLADVAEFESKRADCVQCSSCHSIVCQNGKYITVYRESVIGASVSYTGPDEEYFGCTGTVLAHKKGIFWLKWFGSPEIVKLPMIKPHAYIQQVHLQFKFLCDKNNAKRDENKSEIHLFYEDESEDEAETYHENDKCGNCNSFPCKDGQYLTCFTEVIQGLNVKYSGSARKNQIGVVGTVTKVKDSGYFFVDKFKNYWQFIITPINNSSVGELQFCYSCSTGHVQAVELADSVGAADGEEGDQNHNQQSIAYSFDRCKTLLQSSTVHKENGDKHRIIFKVDRDISLHGVGLNLKGRPTKVIITLLLASDNTNGKWNKTVKNVVIPNIFVETKSLQLPEPIKLSHQETYLLMLSFYGGESFLFGDGMETMTVVIDSQIEVSFSFETYKDDKVTNVNQGVINKLFFRPL